MQKQKLHKIISLFLPAEIICLFGIAVALILNLSLDYKFVQFGDNSGGLLKMLGSAWAYSRLFILAVMLLITVRVINLRTKVAMPPRIMFGYMFNYFRLISFFLIAAYLMCTFKWWAHIDRELWDSYFYEMDNNLQFITGFFQLIYQTIKIDQVQYVDVFVMFFIVGYLQTAIFYPQHLEKMLNAGICVMVIGGMSYLLMPAYGPFIYGCSDNELMCRSQNFMKEVTEMYRHQGGLIKAESFEAALGAMPSLHVAHCMIITIYMFTMHRMIGAVYAVGTLFIVVYSSITKFHYIADIVGGIIIVAIALFVTELLSKYCKKIYA